MPKDNLKDFLRGLTKLEASVNSEVTKEALVKMRQTFLKQIKKFKDATPDLSGKMRDSIKVVGGTVKGVAFVRLIWGVDYASEVNFSENKSKGFATDEYNQEKKSRREAGVRDVTNAFKQVIKRKGYKVK